MYQQMIKETLDRLGRGGANPRHVEAWMRGEHPTLDGLGGAAWPRAVSEAADCVEAAGPQMSEDLARSYDL